MIKKNEKKRKKRYRKNVLSLIVFIICVLLLIAAHIYGYSRDGIAGVIIVCIFIDSWIIEHVFSPWASSISIGLKENKKKKKKNNN